MDKQKVITVIGIISLILGFVLLFFTLYNHVTEYNQIMESGGGSNLALGQWTNGTAVILYVLSSLCIIVGIIVLIYNRFIKR